MSRTDCEILGSPAGEHAPAELRRRFETRRARLLADLDDPRLRTLAERQLDRLYVAYRRLSAGRSSAAERDERTRRLRELIAASLDGDLLRHSARQELLVEGRRLGFNEFHTHLLIAQVQAGAEAHRPLFESTTATANPERAGARLAAAAVLGLAVFLYAFQWVGV